jgi:folate-binding protein YgfZ
VIADRTALVWVEGADSTSFLDGLLSQRIEGLRPGDSARSLFLAPNGKLRAILRVIRAGDRLGLLCDAGAAEGVCRDLTRFKIRVEVRIVQEAQRVWDVWGPEAAVVAGFDGPGVRYEAERLVARNPLLSSDLPRLVVVGDRPDAPALLGDAFAAIRIANGEPVAGVDLDDKVIPQEVLDVSTAVDFDKGCFLGQELVARIESRGHVNRRLSGFAFPGETGPVPGAEVMVGERSIGRVTSVGNSTHHGGAIALGMVRAEIANGTEIRADGIAGRVTSLPIE